MLTLKDFENFGFDKQKPSLRSIPSRTGKGTESAIEGVTYSNNFTIIGYTYFVSDGELYLNTIYNGGNLRLYKGKIETSEQFEKKIKYADTKLRKLRNKKNA